MTTHIFRPRPFDPFALAGLEFDRLLRSRRTARPDSSEGVFGVPVNLYETPTGYLVRSAAPGVAPSDIDVAVEDRELTIRVRRPVVEREGRKVHAERPLGDVTRRVRLARPVDSEAVTASCRDGVLEVTLPFAVTQRRIEVRSV